jgi:hypothetical protein
MGEPHRTFATGVSRAAAARVDWSQTPLGPPTSWPQSLRTAVRSLGSRYAMWMAWGRRRSFAMMHIVRRWGRSPWALGRPAREVWKEIWSDIGPRIGNSRLPAAPYDPDLPLILLRSGYPEETFHTFRTVPCLMTKAASRTSLRRHRSFYRRRRLRILREIGADPKPPE